MYYVIGMYVISWDILKYKIKEQHELIFNQFGKFACELNNYTEIKLFSICLINILINFLTF